MTDSFSALLARIRDRQALVGIIGLGYVGLPLARAFVQKGFGVLGFDMDSTKVALLERGESYIKHIAPETVRQMRGQGFAATTAFERLREPDVVIICVPTPLTDARDPDLSFVVNSAKSVAASLRSGQLIVLESTTYPGTTRDLVLPILAKTGLTAGTDYFLAFSPEREDPGNPEFSTMVIPKVVGGLDEKSRQLAATLYGQVVVKTVPVSSLEVAEASKILENTYRAVNIALVNELKVLFDRMGLDIWEVIDAAKTKPFGFHPFYPGPGLGGHCIPIDPFYLAWVARKYGLTTRFVELAGEVNTQMPAYVVNRLGDALNDRAKPIKGSKITLLGMAYKKNVDDPRESPGFEVMDLLLKKGADVEYNDPHISRLPSMRHYPHLRMESQELTPAYLQSRDAIVIITDHTAYDWPWIVANSPLVVDTRNATRDVLQGRDRIIRA